MRTLLVLFSVAAIFAGCVKGCGDVELDSNAVAVGMVMGAAGAMAGRR